MTDAELLEVYARSGSARAYSEIVRRYAGLVHGTCLRSLRDAHDADDASQATFLVFLRKGRGLPSGTVLAGWFHRVACYCARDIRKSAARRARLAGEVAEMAARTGSKRHESGSCGDAVRPHLDEALEALPRAQRRALVLHYLCGLSREEVAREMRCPQRTVQSRLRLGIEKLRRKLACRMEGRTVPPAAALAGLLGEWGAQQAPASLIASIQALAGSTAGASPGVAAAAEGVMEAMFWKKVKMVAAVLCVAAAAGTGGTWAVAAALAADGAPATAKKPAQDKTKDWMASLRKDWAARDAYARGWDRKAPKPVKVFSHGGRVPLIVLTHKGTLLAFQEKYITGGDTGDHDAVVARSTDGGKTWGKEILIYDAGKANVNHPIPVVAADGTIWLTFTVRLKKVFVTHSRDDGKTWAKPKVIATEKRCWTGHHSILHSSGRILFAANSEGGPQWCYYSDDHGTTWNKTKPFARGGLQTSLVELVDGSVYANIRRFGRHKRPNRRSECWSRDGGLTWSDAKACKQLLDAGSAGCSSSLIRVTDERIHDRNRVMFVGPDAGDPETHKGLGRINGTAHISYDECRTWKKCKRIVNGKFGYSDLVLLPDMRVGCIYESAGGYKCSFARFTVEWITDGEDKVDFSRFKKK